VNFFGGGAAWNDETASKPLSPLSMAGLTEGFYISHLPQYVMGLMHVGLLAENDAKNPFDGWNTINIHYTTADFHLGRHDFHYGNERVLHHRGDSNVAAALAFLQKSFPNTPEMLVIAGSSAGAFGCVAHSPGIHALYPECSQVLVYSEGSHLHNPNWPSIAREKWKVNPQLQAYIQGADLICDLFGYAKDHLPKGTAFLHSNSIYDKTLAQFMHKMNHGKLRSTPEALQEFNQTLKQAVSRLKTEIPNYYFYLTDFGKHPKTGATPHTFSGSPKLLYQDMQDGVALAGWLRQAIAGVFSDVGEQFLDENE